MNFILNSILIIIISIIISSLIGYFVGIYSSKNFLKKYKLILKIKQKNNTKIRKRYIVFEILSTNPIDIGLLESTIIEKFKELYGTTILSDSYIKLIGFNEESKRGIIRIRSEYVNNLIATISLIRKIGKDDLIIIPVRASGTIKKAKKFIL
ncbi:MAG: Rpp14/Pop5 family protein [Caldisphaera sp.]|jgi:ribonuclease P/MRP protein subunit POP5|nr:MAG: hypothetical protein C0201_04470 [Caldisphaera sp.]